ncbi:MAG: HEAT repeat domain-containing protein [Phycisphaeraceae bacterium]
MIILIAVLGGGGSGETPPAPVTPPIVANVTPTPPAVDPGSTPPTPDPANKTPAKTITPPETPIPDPQPPLPVATELNKDARRYLQLAFDHVDTTNSVQAVAIMCKVLEDHANGGDLDVAKAALTKCIETLKPEKVRSVDEALKLIGETIGRAKQKELRDQAALDIPILLGRKYAKDIWALSFLLKAMVDAGERDAALEVVEKLDAFTRSNSTPFKGYTASLRVLGLGDMDGALASVGQMTDQSYRGYLNAMTVVTLLKRGEAETAKRWMAHIGTDHPSISTTQAKVAEMSGDASDAAMIELLAREFKLRANIMLPRTAELLIEYMQTRDRDLEAMALVEECNRTMVTYSGSGSVIDYSLVAPALARAGRIEELRAMAETLLPRNPGTSRVGILSTDHARGARLMAAYAMWSKLLGNEAGYTTGVQAIHKAVEFEPLLKPLGLATLAVAQYRCGRTEEAKKTLEGVALAKVQRLAPAWRDYILLKTRLGDVEKAEAPLMTDVGALPMTHRAMALGKLEAGHLSAALTWAISADPETLEQVVKLAAAKDGIATVNDARQEISNVVPGSDAWVYWAMSRAAQDPRPLATFFDPRLKVIDPKNLNLAKVPPAAQGDQMKGLIERLDDEDTVVRQNSCMLLAQMGADALPAVQTLGRLRVFDPDTRVKAEAGKAMDAILNGLPSKYVVRTPDAAVLALVVALYDPNQPDSYQRPVRNCLDALVSLADSTVAAETVLPAMLDKLPGVSERYPLVERLTPHANDATIAKLIARITDEDEQIGASAARILLDIAKSKSISEPLAELLKDPSEVIRRQLVTGVTLLHALTPAQMLSVLPMLKERDVELRSIVADRIASSVYNLSANITRQADLTDVAEPLKIAMDPLRNDPDFSTRRSADSVTSYLRQPPRPDGTRTPIRTSGNRTETREVLAALRDGQSTRSKLTALGLMQSDDMVQVFNVMIAGFDKQPLTVKRAFADRFRSAGSSLKHAKRSVLQILEKEQDSSVRGSLQTLIGSLEDAEDQDIVTSGPPGKGPSRPDPFGNKMDAKAALLALTLNKTPARDCVTAINILMNEKERDPRLPALLRNALRHRHFAVRNQAAQSIGQLDDRSLVPALINALTDWNDRVRTDVVRTLARLAPDDEAVLAALAKLNDDPLSVVRYIVCQVLADHGSVEALHTLIELSLSRNSNMRGSPSRGLLYVAARLTPEQQAAVKELPPILYEHLRSPQQNSREQAISMVEILGGAAHSATPALVEAALKSGSDTAFRVHSALVAIAIENDAAVKAVADLVVHPSHPLRAAAFNALHRVRGRAKPHVDMIREKAETLQLSPSDRAALERTLKSIESATELPTRSPPSGAEKTRYDLS